MQATPYGSFLEAEDVGNLADGEADDLLEDEGDPEVIRKLDDRRLELGARFLADRCLYRVALVTRDHADERLAEGEERFERLDLLRFTGAKAVHPLASARRDPIEPRLLARFAAEVLPAAKDVEEDFLHEVLRLPCIAAEAHRQLVELRAVGVEEAAYGFVGGPSRGVGLG